MTNQREKTLCMMSTTHDLTDDRIYKKEAVTLSKNGCKVIHIGYGNKLADYITDENIRIIEIPKKRKGETVTSIYKALKQTKLTDLFQKAKEIKADVYHLHDMELCRIALKLKKLPWQPKVIYDAHEPFFENLKDYWKERSLFKVFFNDIPSILAEKRILKKVDYLIATEENVASRFRKKNKKTAIIYNYSYFYPEDISVPAEQKEYDAIYCGSISEAKGILLIIDSLIESKKRGFNLKYVIVGGLNNDELKKRVEKKIQENNISENIVFTGHLSIDRINSYYKKSKVAFCLFPLNNTNQLILPIKLFEYAAFGLPIIGSNFGHIREVIETNNFGVCVNPHDAKEVTSAIIQLITDNNYATYYNDLVNKVKNNYLWESQEEELLRIYENIGNE